MTSVQSGVKDAVERVTAELEDAARYESLSASVTIADLRTLLAALSSQAEVMEAMAKGLEPFAALADKFTGPMVEVCNPHPDNPSRNIQPFATRHLEDAFQGLAQYRSLNGDA